LADAQSHNPLLALTAEELSSNLTQTLIPSKQFVLAFASKPSQPRKLPRLLTANMFKLHGLPTEIVSDHGSQFISKIWDFILKTLLIKRKLSTAYHPKTDGQTEKTNQTLQQYLCCYINYQQDN
jgi:transposase InsO family protein